MARRTRINVVMLLVLAVRSLLPAGFMVQAAHASDAMFDVVICTGAGLVTLTADHTGTAPPSQPPHADSDICPYAAGGGAALLALDPPRLADAAEYASVVYALAVALFDETPKPGATSARGPPALLV